LFTELRRATARLQCSWKGRGTPTGKKRNFEPRAANVKSVVTNIPARVVRQLEPKSLVLDKKKSRCRQEKGKGRRTANKKLDQSTEPGITAAFKLKKKKTGPKLIGSKKRITKWAEQKEFGRNGPPSKVARRKKNLMGRKKRPSGERRQANRAQGKSVGRVKTVKKVNAGTTNSGKEDKKRGQV